MHLDSDSEGIPLEADTGGDTLHDVTSRNQRAPASYDIGQIAPSWVQGQGRNLRRLSSGDNRPATKKARHRGGPFRQGAL